LAGSLWISRLSTAEVKAVVLYSLEAREYATVMAGERKATQEESNLIRHLHSAVAKAPLTERPFLCYAGISTQRQEGLREQGERGSITLNRVQSASLNPAQVNGFTHWDDATSLVLEVRTERLASLTPFNVHRGEMEVLLPPGSYRVVKKQEGNRYLWPGGLGRTVGTTLQVEAL